MALKSSEQVQFDSLNQTVLILAGLGHDKDTIKSQLAPMSSKLENESGCKLILDKIEGVLQYSLLDLKGDFLSTRFNGDETMLSMKAKLLGLPIDVKIIKGDKLRASNQQVVSSLQCLIDLINKMPDDMCAAGKGDWDVNSGVLLLEDGSIPGVEGKTESELPNDMPLNENESRFADRKPGFNRTW